MIVTRALTPLSIGAPGTGSSLLSQGSFGLVKARL